ncbi:MAG TPA: TerB family tellurite resistance protein [Ohtaekwangia sp.]|nr:TerB family tellurite resistance protein [Ohtaekwangia sp.]
MKRVIIYLIVFTACLPVYSQTQEAAQLLLNYEKLRQLEEILDNMYKGYKILTQGYARIKGIAEGNYKLHQVFLDALLNVSPTVRNYKRIPQIINYQRLIVKEYQRAYSRFKEDENLTPGELRYIKSVYEYLTKQSLKNLEELAMIITASTLRMSDDERLSSIDRVFFDVEDKLQFLRSFNNSTQLLIIQRAKERSNVKASEKLNLD